MKTSAVIPAYNEEETLGNVIQILKEHHLIDEIIVVDDGSTDNTAEVAVASGVKIIIMDSNRGKGAAMQKGIDYCQGNIILFLDADLLGLQAIHIERLVKPLLEDKADMTVGIFTSGRVITDLAHKITPFLSGQRAVKKELLSGIKDLDLTSYGVEIAITNYVKQAGVEIKQVELEDLSHRMKEEKFGFAKGIKARFRMYWDLLKNISDRFKLK